MSEPHHHDGTGADDEPLVDDLLDETRRPAVDQEQPDPPTTPEVPEIPD
ncbi:hypothetical protein [Kribbella swartbergensis]